MEPLQPGDVRAGVAGRPAACSAVALVVAQMVGVLWGVRVGACSHKGGCRG